MQGGRGGGGAGVIGYLRKLLTSDVAAGAGANRASRGERITRENRTARQRAGAKQEGVSGSEAARPPPKAPVRAHMRGCT